MYFAMNRFMIAPGFEEAFETMWRERESYLDQVPGFQPFICLKGNHKKTIRPTFRTPSGYLAKRSLHGQIRASARPTVRLVRPRACT